MSTQVNNQTVGDINNANVANVNNNTQKASKQSKQKGFDKAKRFEQNCHWWIWVTNILLLGVNVFILCRFAPASDELDFDYYGVIVGVLSFLVTVLLGINIWGAINVDERITKISEESDEKIDRMLDEFKGLEQQTSDRLNEQEERNKNQYDIQGRAFMNLERNIIASRAQIEEDFAKMLVKMPENNSFPQAIPHAIKALNSWATIGKYKSASACVLFVTLLEGTAKLLDDKEKEKLLNMVKDVPSQKNIKGIENLYVIFSIENKNK